MLMMGLLGVFAWLVLALVFKTGVGCEQRSRWVRFPSTSACQKCLQLLLFASISEGDFMPIFSGLKIMPLAAANIVIV